MESKIDNCIIPMDGDEYSSNTNISKEFTEIANTYNDDPEILNSKSKYDNKIASTHAVNVNKMNIEQKNTDGGVKEFYKQQTGESLLQSSQNILQSNITMSAPKLYQNQMKIFPTNSKNCHKWKNENEMSSSMTNFVLNPQNLASDTTYITYSDSTSDTDKIDRACLQINRLEDAIKEDCEMENVGDLQAITSELHNQLRNQSNTNIIDEVMLALHRFELSLKAGKCTNTNKEKRKLLLSLINSLQAGLKSTTKAASDTTYNLDDLHKNVDNNNLNNINNNINHRRFSKCRNRSLRHTIGVSYKELADARECMEKIKTASNSPAYEDGMSNINSLNNVLGYNSIKDLTTPCLNMNLKNINYNKNADLMKRSSITEQAFLNDSGQINITTNQFGKNSSSLGNFKIPKTTSNTEDSANKKYFMKRANTIDIAKMKNSIKCYNGSNNVIDNDRNYNANFKNITSGNDKKSKEEKKSIIPPLIPKTLNDIKFLAFINKQDDKVNMGWYGTRTNSNWTDKFYYIKKTFESGNSSNTINEHIGTKPLQTLNANSNEHYRLHQNKNESHTRSLTDLKQKSETKYKLKFNQTLTLKNAVPSIINQFKHAAHSVFKPMPHVKSNGKLTNKTSSKENINSNRISGYGNQNLQNNPNATIKINSKNKINNNNNQCSTNDGKTYLKRNISLYHPNKNKSQNEEFRRRFSVSENSVAIYNPTYTNSELTSLEELPPPININFYYATPSSNPNLICATDSFSSSQALTADHSRFDNLVQKQQQLNNTHDQYCSTIKYTNAEAPPLILSYTNPKFDYQDYYNGVLKHHSHPTNNDTSPHTYNIADNFCSAKNNSAEFCAVSKIMGKPKCHTATTTLKQLSHITDPNTDAKTKKLRNSLLDIRSNNIKQNKLHNSMPSIQTPQNDTYTSYSVVHSALYLDEADEKKALIKNAANDLHQLNTMNYLKDRAVPTASHQSSHNTTDFTCGRHNIVVKNSINKNSGVHEDYSNRMNNDFLSDSQSTNAQNTSYCTYSSNVNLECQKSLNTSLVQSNQLNKTMPPSYVTESKCEAIVFTNRRIPKEFATQESGMKYKMQSQNKSNQMSTLENNKNSKYQMKENSINMNAENNRKSIIISDAPDVIKSSLQIKSQSYDHKDENLYHKKYTCDSRLESKNKQDTIAKMQYPVYALPATTICNNVQDVEPSLYRQHPNKISNHIGDKRNVSVTSIKNLQINPKLCHNISQDTKSQTTLSNKKEQSLANLKFSSINRNSTVYSTTAVESSKNTKLVKFGSKSLNSRTATAKEQLLNWCRSKTEEYPNIEITNFSSSWSDGLAFCALIHHFLPNAFDYNKLTKVDQKKNFELAFSIAEEKAGIAPLLDVDDMVNMKCPDWKCVFVYVQSIHYRFRNSQ